MFRFAQSVSSPPLDGQREKIVRFEDTGSLVERNRSAAKVTFDALSLVDANFEFVGGVEFLWRDASDAFARFAGAFAN